MTKRHVLPTFGLFALVAILSGSINAQFTITIPKLPKNNKSVPVQVMPQTETEDAAASSEAVESPMKGLKVDSSASDSGTDSCTQDWWVKEMAKDITDTRAEAEGYRPGLRDYYVSTLSDGQNKFMEAALSPSRRAEWFKDANLDAVKRGCMDILLDDLAGVARKTLPTYTGPAGYALGTPAEKKLLLSEINDIAGAKVLKVGIKQANWLIDKDTYNFPTSRYKHGVIIANYPNADHGYCWLFWVNIIQDYAGGGTYGASYGRYISRAVSGCPIAK